MPIVLGSELAHRSVDEPHIDAETPWDWVALLERTVRPSWLSGRPERSKGIRMMRLAVVVVLALVVGTWAIGPRGSNVARSQSVVSDPDRRAVVLELYTSQGCYYCPKAEEVLAQLGAERAEVVPIAFHVDYFNVPWVDPFSKARYTRRQRSYTSIHRDRTGTNQNLTYTPLLMVNGTVPVNGRNRQAALRAIEQVHRQKPEVTLEADLTDDGRLTVTLTPNGDRLDGRRVLVTAVVRDDEVITRVPSGENGGKTLVNRHPARTYQTRGFDVDGSAAELFRIDFDADPEWKADTLRVAVFAQDANTGEIYQALDIPWRR